ncbi:MAG: hypothetical protein WC243_04695 [Patescibacteria group bacterium]|jgi:hypothetical protein
MRKYLRRGLLSLLLVLGISFVSFPRSFAKVGVGVNVGIIQVSEILKAGMIYDLPPVTVINTGDEPSNYGLSIAHRSGQKQLIPEDSWFTFEPESFYLEPEQTGLVRIKVQLPLKTEPGDYFAFLEAQPTSTVKRGGASVGVAAASKLFFTVAPANIFLGIFYRLSAIWTRSMPWSAIIAGILGLGILIAILRKFIHIEIKAAPSKKDSKKDGTDSLHSL